MVELDATTEQALASVLSAAEARAGQWQNVGRGADPSDVVDELYEAGSDEANTMGELLAADVAVVSNWLRRVRERKKTMTPAPVVKL